MVERKYDPSKIYRDADGEPITWFVCRFPSKDANEGSVMWEHEFDTKGECDMKCLELKQADPDPAIVYESSCLEELTEVFERDVMPMAEAEAAKAKGQLH